MAKKNFNLLTVLKSDVSNFVKGFNKANKSVSKFSKRGKSGMGGVAAMGAKLMPILAALGGANAIKNLVVDSVQLVGKLEGIQAAFSKINNASLLGELRTATKGTIDDMQLMKYSVEANYFQIPLDQLSTYFEFATNRAAETGESVDYLVNSLVTGLGRKSALILDNLGISAVELQQKTKEVGDFGAAAGIIIQKEIAKAGDVTKTTGQKFDTWKAKLTNIKLSFGKQLMPAINSVMDKLTTSLPIVIQFFSDFSNSIIDVYNEFVDVYDKSVAFRMVVETIKGAFKTLGLMYKTTFSAIGKSLVLLKDLVKAIFDPNIKVSDVWNDFKEELKNLGGDAYESGKLIADEWIEGVKNGIGKKLHKKVSLSSIIDTSTLGNDSLSVPATIKVIDIDDESLDDVFDSLEVPDIVPDLKAVALSWKDVGNAIASVDVLTSVLNTTINGLTDAFSSLFSDSEVGFKDIITALLQSTQQIINMLLAQAMAGLIAGGAVKGGLVGMLIAGTVGMAALMGLWSKIPAFESGGIVGGTSFSGDKQLIRVNSGEMILNPFQQKNLLGGGFGGGELSTRISGNDLLVVLNRTNRKHNNM